MGLMNWITFWIAVAGFLMSFATWIKDFLTQRKNIEGKILQIKSFKSVTYFSLLIENRSRVPIAITNVSLLFKGKTYVCEPMPFLVSQHTRSQRGRVYDRTMTYSTALPIQVPGLGASTALVLFRKMKEIPPNGTKHLTLLISTNRGKPVQMTLELPAEWEIQRSTP